MENEKRKVGDYTVLCAVNIGSREIILAENEQSANGERFLCCYGERNDIFEKFTECAVGDDYIDAALFFAERIKKDAEQFRAEVEKLDIPVTVITQVDCIPDHYKNDINGKIIAINPAVLKPEYQRADRQLYYVTGGFGASANARGSAVFCKNLYDGKNTRFERMDVLGEIKPERSFEFRNFIQTPEGQKRRDRTRMDGICEKPDGERHRLSLLLTQLCTTGLQRLGKPFP